MARTKTYRSKLYARYSTRIKKGDAIISVEFVNGFRVGGTLNGGMLTTSDESLQEAIEATDKFKKGDLYCSYDSGNVADKPIKSAPILPVNPTTSKLPIEKPIKTEDVPIVKPITSTAKVIETVKTRQEARMFFRDAGEQGMTPMLSFNTINKLALKYNVEFPNLK